MSETRTANLLKLDQKARKQAIKTRLEAARTRTLWLLDQVPDEMMSKRVHHFYSPIGWHFGHIGMTEGFWVLQKAFQQPALNDHYSFLFANLPENSKDNRCHLPDRKEITRYLAHVRELTFEALETAEIGVDSPNPYLRDGYAWEFAFQHECQHQETITEMMQLICQRSPVESIRGQREWRQGIETQGVGLPGGEAWIGSDDYHGYDNEKQRHRVQIAPFELDKIPVTAWQFSQFIEAGGYDQPQWWTIDGWQWKTNENARRPEYWLDPEEADGYAIISPLGARWLHPDEPVSSVSLHEAQAYARWQNKRLPTEFEWEYAASFDPASGGSRRFPWGDRLATQDVASFGLNAWHPLPVWACRGGESALGLEQMAGGVWEWTSSAFLPYPGFQAFPYEGYSLESMKGEHFVCRGGSWATSRELLRCSFRNFYVPGYRQGLLGFRCAR